MKALTTWILTALVIVGGYAATGTILVGCTAAWWQNVATPANVQSLITYAESFIEGAQALWAIILPLVPSASAAQANTDFNNGVLTAQKAIAVLEDAYNAAQGAQQSNPNFATLIAALQDAISQVMGIVQTWQGSAAATATAKASVQSQVSELQRQATVIKNWGTSVTTVAPAPAPVASAAAH
jgi:hypothetical protein